MTLCPRCQRPHKPGDHFCECGYDFWRAAQLEGRLAASGTVATAERTPGYTPGELALLGLGLCAAVIAIVLVIAHMGQAPLAAKRAAIPSPAIAELWPPGYGTPVCGALYELEIRTGPAINDLITAMGSLDAGELIAGTDRITRSAGSAKQLLDRVQPWPTGDVLLQSLNSAVASAQRAASTVKVGAQSHDPAIAEAAKNDLVDAAAGLRDATASFVALHASTGAGC